MDIDIKVIQPIVVVIIDLNKKKLGQFLPQKAGQATHRDSSVAPIGHPSAEATFGPLPSLRVAPKKQTCDMNASLSKTAKTKQDL